jgi:hypothetical protein
MELFKRILIEEGERAADAQVKHAISVINKIYNEWKKTKRRINAVDIITTSINKISNISPALLPFIHDAAKLKLVIIITRCMDSPPWEDISRLEKRYKKLFPLIKLLQNITSTSESGGSLREVIMTRLSANICYNDKTCKTFVGYEPIISKNYLKYLLGTKQVEKAYRMQSLPLPDDFERLIETLKINHEKAKSKFEKQTSVE